jgi:hypothetical protein
MPMTIVRYSARVLAAFSTVFFADELACSRDKKVVSEHSSSVAMETGAAHHLFVGGLRMFMTVHAVQSETTLCGSSMPCYHVSAHAPLHLPTLTAMCAQGLTRNMQNLMQQKVCQHCQRWRVNECSKDLPTSKTAQHKRPASRYRLRNSCDSTSPVTSTQHA